jgi:hypothetical protein
MGWLVWVRSWPLKKTDCDGKLCVLQSAHFRVPELTMENENDHTIATLPALLRQNVLEPLSIIGGLTAGVTGFLVAMGALAVSGRDHSLGLAVRSPSVLHYAKTGYEFFIGSAAAAFVVGKYWALGIFAVAALVYWARAQWLATLEKQERRPPEWFVNLDTPLGWTRVAYLILVVVALLNIFSLVQILQTTDTLFRRLESLDLLPDRAQSAARALVAGAGGVDTLGQMYGVNVATFIGLALGALFVSKVKVADAVATRGWKALRVLTPLLISLQLALVPWAYGLCLMAGAVPRCVQVALHPDVNPKIRLAARSTLIGFLVSDLSDDTGEIQLFALRPQAKIILLHRSDIVSIDFLNGSCGQSVYAPDEQADNYSEPPPAVPLPAPIAPKK